MIGAGIPGGAEASSLPHLACLAHAGSRLTGPQSQPRHPPPPSLCGPGQAAGRRVQLETRHGAPGQPAKAVTPLWGCGWLVGSSFRQPLSFQQEVAGVVCVCVCAQTCGSKGESGQLTLCGDQLVTEQGLGCITSSAPPPCPVPQPWHWKQATLLAASSGPLLP